MLKSYEIFLFFQVHNYINNNMQISCLVSEMKTLERLARL